MQVPDKMTEREARRLPLSFRNVETLFIKSVKLLEMAAV